MFWNNPVGFANGNTFSTGSTMVLPFQAEVIPDFGLGAPGFGGSPFLTPPSAAFAPGLSLLPQSPGFLAPAIGVPNFGGLYDGLYGIDLRPPVSPPSLSRPTQQDSGLASLLKSLVMFLLLEKLLSGLGGGQGNPSISRPQRPTRPPAPPPPPVIDGPRTSSFKDGEFTFSGRVLTQIYRDPKNAKQYIVDEVLNIFKDKDLTAILKDLIGVEIPTADSNHRKRILSYDLFDQIMNNLTDNVLDGLGIDAEGPFGHKQTKVDPLTGVFLSHDDIRQIRENKDTAKDTLTNIIFQAGGVNSKAELMAKLINHPNHGVDYWNQHTNWTNQMFDLLINNLINRYTG